MLVFSHFKSFFFFKYIFEIHLNLKSRVIAFRAKNLRHYAYQELHKKKQQRILYMKKFFLEDCLYLSIRSFC